MVKRPELCPVPGQPSNLGPGHQLCHPTHSVSGGTGLGTRFASKEALLPKASKSSLKPRLQRPLTPEFMRRSRQFPLSVAALNRTLQAEQTERESNLRASFKEDDRNRSLAWWVAANGRPRGYIPPSVTAAKKEAAKASFLASRGC